MQQPIDSHQLLEIAKKACLQAGERILEVYEQEEVGIEAKSDNSPLTIADRNAHQVIVEALSETNIPVLSEEGRDIPYAERKEWEYFWMVDPLDGTKEFIKKNGEFTVNIALIHQQQAVMGVVYVPVQQKLYWGAKGEQAFVQTGEAVPQPLTGSPAINFQQEGLRVVASRSHLNQETLEFLEKMSSPEIVSMGSSLKFMLLAEGKADVYPRFGPTMEWDTAAAHAILNALEIPVWQMDQKQELVYNKEDLLNPHFIAGKVVSRIKN